MKQPKAKQPILFADKELENCEELANVIVPAVEKMEKIFAAARYRSAVPEGSESEAETEPTIPITKAEIKRIREIARGIDILEVVSSENTQIEIGTFWWLIDKMSKYSWTLGFETLADRWEKQYPNDKFGALD